MRVGKRERERETEKERDKLGNLPFLKGFTYKNPKSFYIYLPTFL